MASPNLSDLLVALTKEQIKAALLADLQGRSFPVSDWLEGAVVRTLIDLFCGALARLYVLVASIAAGGFVNLASGDWLTLAAREVYQLERIPSAFTQGYVKLTSAAGAGPYTIAIGQLFFQSASGKRFTNITGGTLNAASTLVLQVQAESPGASYNVPEGTILTMVTPLPGVTVTNPLRLGSVTHTGSGTGTVTPSGTPSLNALVVVKLITGGATGAATFQASLDGGATWGTTTVTGGAVVLAGTGITLAFAGTFTLGDRYSFSTSWISTSGRDAEADADLQARCNARWPDLGEAPTEDVYDLWARTAAPTVVKTMAQPSDTVPGQVDLYLATAAGVTPGGDVSAVADFVAAREPLMLTSNVQSAAPSNIAVEATLYVQAAYLATAPVDAEGRLEALIAALPIGGTLYLSELGAQLTPPAGITHVVVTLPAADVALGAGDVATLSPAPVLTIVPV